MLETQDPGSRERRVRDNMAAPNSPSKTVSVDGELTVLIVTNLVPDVFSEPGTQAEFESAFREVDSDVSFTYLRHLHRAKVQFSSAVLAAAAKARYDGVVMFGQIIQCLYLQPRAVADNNFLRPPEPKRIFLLSPPASPPFGWEMTPDVEPVINEDLIKAIRDLEAGKMYVLHHGSANKPSIVLHLADDIAGAQTGKQQGV